MTVLIRSSSTYASTVAETTSVVTLPAGLQAGDLIYVGWELTASVGTLTVPAGWSEIVPQFNSSSSTSALHGVLKRIAQAGDTSVSITHTSGRFAAVAVSIIGFDPTNPEDVTPTTDANSGVTTPSVRAPSITPISDGCLLLTWHTVRNGTNAISTAFTPDASETEQADISSAVAAASNAAVELAYKQIGTASATGTKTATATGTDVSIINQMGSAIAVRPQPVAFDAVGPSASGATAAANTTLSWTHTNVASGVALIVFIATGGTNAFTTGTTTVKLDPSGANTAFVALSPKIESDQSVNGALQVFGLANVSSGAHTITATSTVAFDLEGGSLSYSGADLVNPFGTVQTVSSVGITSPQSLISPSSTAGNMIACGAACGSTINSPTAGTSRFIANLNTATAAGNVAGADLPAGGSKTFTWSATGTDDWALAAVEILLPFEHSQLSLIQAPAFMSGAPAMVPTALVFPPIRFDDQVQGGVDSRAISATGYLASSSNTTAQKVASAISETGWMGLVSQVTATKIAKASANSALGFAPVAIHVDIRAITARAIMGLESLASAKKITPATSVSPLGLEGLVAAKKINVASAANRLGLLGLATAAKRSTVSGNSAIGFSSSFAHVPVVAVTARSFAGLVALATAKKVAPASSSGLAGFEGLATVKKVSRLSSSGFLGLEGLSTVRKVAVGGPRAYIGLLGLATAKKSASVNGSSSLGFDSWFAHVPISAISARGFLGLTGINTDHQKIVRSSSVGSLGMISTASAKHIAKIVNAIESVGLVARVVAIKKSAITGRVFIGLLPPGVPINEGVQPQSLYATIGTGLMILPSSVAGVNEGAVSVAGPDEGAVVKKGEDIPIVILIPRDDNPTTRGGTGG